MRRHIAISALLALAGAPAAVASPADELVVRFDAGAGISQRAAALDAAGLTPTGTLMSAAPAVVALDGDTGRRAALEVLRDQPGVRWAEPNLVYRALAVPNDPLLPRQWGLRNLGQGVDGVVAIAGADIGAPAAWDRGTGDPSVNVAVIDSGVATGHPDLAPNISASVPGTDLVDGDASPADVEGHGTLVAGIIGARGDDGVGMAGVAWRLGLVPVRVLDANGGGSSAKIAEGMRYAAQRGVRLVNASLGGASNSAVIAEAISANPGTLFVVAAGNEGKDVDQPGQGLYPCALAFENVLCVANSDASDRLSRSSNYGARSVDLAAPGDAVLGPAPAYAAPAFADDFEAGLGAWTTSPGAAWGLEPAADGTVLSDSPGGLYGPAGSGTITTAAPFSLAGGTGCRLVMHLRLATAGGDGLIAEASANGGPWTTVGSYTGTSDGRARRVSESMEDQEGAFNVRLRLRFLANSGVPADGAAINDLQVACLGGAFDAGDYITESGTSFAAPHVTGVAAVIMARHPQLTAVQVKQAILQGVVRLPSLTGRVVTGGRLSFPGALDAAEAIAGGASPGTGPPSGGVSGEAAVFRLKPAVRRGALWTIDAVLSRAALAEVTLERRRPGTGVRGVRARWLVVRTNGPRDRAGSFRVSLGRLGKGVYRVTVRFPEERRTLRRTFSVAPRR